MSETKKLLVAFDRTRPEAQSSDFLIPWNRDGQRVFLGLKSGKESALGTMVFIGRSITENDLFARLVDSGRIIANVDCTLALLRSYLDKLQALKIGNVVRILSTGEVDSAQFEWELVAKSPSGFKM